MWECLGCCPACAAVAFMAEGCVMVAPGAKGSFPSSTDDATKPKNIIPLSNPHTRTTGFQGTRMYMPEPPGTKSDSHYRYYTAKNPRYLLVNIVLVVTVEVFSARDSEPLLGCAFSENDRGVLSFRSARAVPACVACLSSWPPVGSRRWDRLLARPAPKS